MGSTTGWAAASKMTMTNDNNVEDDDNDYK